jgi:hypothetical protein
MSGGIASAEQRPIDGAVEGDGDSAQRRERMPIETTRRNDIEAGGPALQDGGEGRRATRTRDQG